jgi:hypothetical protein
MHQNPVHGAPTGSPAECRHRAAEGERVTFVRFLRLGLPITLIQLAASAVYVVYILPLLT